MKKLNIFLTLTALSAGILGISLKRDKAELKVEASGMIGGTEMYFEPGTVWDFDGAKFAMWLFDGTENDSWVEFNFFKDASDGKNVYSATIPGVGGFKKVIFVRQDPKSSGAWQGEWGRVNDVEYESGKNLFVMNDYNSGSWRNLANVSFNVTIPKNTPLNDDIYIAGNFGDDYPNWAPDNSWGKLIKGSKYLYTFNLTIPITSDFTISYKYSRGSWETAESNSEGHYRDNRDYTIKLDNLSPSINDVVLQWEDKPEGEPDADLPEFTKETEGINESKVRIWLDRSGYYGIGYTIMLKVGEVYYEPNGYEAAIHADNRSFCYYDLPKNKLVGKLIELVVYEQLKWKENTISVGVYEIGDNNKVWKINKSGDNYSVTKGAITEKILPKFFAKVLEGYLTCSPSVENGYGAFPEMDNNFLPKEAGTGNFYMHENLDGNMITDYSGTGTGNYGEDRYETAVEDDEEVLVYGVEVDAYDKYMALKNMYNNGKVEGGQESVSIPQNQNVNPTLVIAILGLATLGGYYFLSRKKKMI